MRKSEFPSEQKSRIEWWRRLISRQQSTPVPLTQFCRQMGINPRKFYYWRKRLREMDAASSGPPITTSGSLQLKSTVPSGSRLLAGINYRPRHGHRYQLWHDHRAGDRAG